jgi:hypothetical protein
MGEREMRFARRLNAAAEKGKAQKDYQPVRLFASVLLRSETSSVVSAYKTCSGERQHS